MAIGTLAAIGLGLAAAGQVAGSISANKGANKAAATATQTADKNNALARETRDMNNATLKPWQAGGMAAFNQSNAMLGLDQPNALGQFSGGQDFGGYVQNNPDVAAEFGRVGGNFNNDQSAFGQFHYNTYGRGEGRQLPQQSQMVQTNPMDGFRKYIENSDYGFQFGEGANRVNSGYAGNGTLQSGSAMRALEDYRQNLQTGYRGEYMDRLGQQQQIGANAASAQVGVGNQFASNVTANNNMSGTAVANAALAKGSNNPFANILSTVGGGLYGYKG